MKKLICLLSMIFMAATASAQVTLIKQSINNGEKSFVQSRLDGKIFYSTDTGAQAVISDTQLKAYTDQAPFVAGILDASGVTMHYCIKSGSNKQFAFAYHNSVTTGNVIHMHKVGKKVYCS